MPRFNVAKHPEATAPLRALTAYLQKSSLDRSLIELINMRASQLNGCGYCLDMHSKDARAEGETEQRLYLLQVWRETELYSAKERAALAWCEAVTHLDPIHGVPEDVYAQALGEFGPDGLVDLNMAVIAINAWNRIAIPSKMTPGSYRRGEHG